MPTIYLASRNAHKLIEIQRMRPDITWLALPDELGDPPETSDTFEANALEKAQYVFAKTGHWALSDDSGLAVDALGGRPGVFSKRYSPEATDTANNTLLLRELADVPPPQRTARYVCVLALVGPNGQATVTGTCEGHIGYVARGTGGFGYDPLFEPLATPGKTCGELSPTEKDAISHRGAAMQQLDSLLSRAGAQE